MNKDSHLIFENYVDGITRRKNELAGNIMDIVRYGIPTKEEFIKIRQELHDLVDMVKKRGDKATEEENSLARELIGKIRSYRSQHPDDPPVVRNLHNPEENEESSCIEDLAKKHGVSLEDITKQLEMGLKVEMEHTDNMDIAKKIAMDHLAEDPHYYSKLSKMEKGENAEDTAEDKMKNRENERDEKQRDREVSSAFHYDPMSGLAKAANQIKDILHGAANDEARTEHIIKMAQIILGDPKEHSPAEYRKMLDGLIVLLNRFIVVPMNEYEEMPAKQFMDLKKHINKGPIQIKMPTKELHPTNPKIHDLAKKDSREEDSESKVHPAEKKYGEQLNARKEMEHSFKDWLNKKRAEGKARNYPQKAPHEVRQHWKKKEENEERRLDPKCWKGYHKQGTKLKGGVRVNNCVKNS